MNKNPYGKDNKFFYVVVALSVLSVLAASAGIWFTAKKIRSAGEEPTQTKVDWDNHPASVSDTQANKRETGVSDDRTEKNSKTEKLTTDSKSEKTTSQTVKDTTVQTTKATATTESTIDCSLPLGSAILKDYSNGTMVKSKTMNDWRTHNGVDFTGEQGDEIRAVCIGTVRQITTEPSWGTVVTIEHDNGITARYCGLDTVKIAEGDRVSGGETIGTLGVIPVESADTVHLHFETLRDGEYVDPVQALSLQREED